MRRLVLFGIVVAAFLGPAFAEGQARRAMHAIELPVPSGVLRQEAAGDKTHPVFDVAKIALISDGTKLTMTLTLRTPPPSGFFTSELLRVYFDTDDNPATGAEEMWSREKGFEQVSCLTACVEYDDGTIVCSGDFREVDVKGCYVVATLDEFRVGASSTEKVKVISPFEAPRNPVSGTTISASLTYEAMGLVSGQTVRIAIREVDGPPDAAMFFPDVILTLK